MERETGSSPEQPTAKPQVLHPEPAPPSPHPDPRGQPPAGTPPNASGEDGGEKEALWHDLIEGYHAAAIPRALAAYRMKVDPGQLSRIETHGVQHVRLATLRRLAANITGWAESRTRPAHPESIRQIADRELMQRVTERVMVTRFDQSLFRDLLNPNRESRLTPQEFADRLRAFETVRGNEAVNLSYYLNEVAQPRLDEMREAAAEYSGDAAFQRVLDASAGIVTMLQDATAPKDSSTQGKG